MKKKLLILTCSVLVAGQSLLPSSVKAGVKEQEELTVVIDEINKKNEELDAPIDSIDRFCYNYKNSKPKVTKKDNSLMWEDYDRKNILPKFTVYAAKKEVHWLFRLLRSQYGLYTYYGGDAKFEKAEKLILKDVGSKGMISAKKYQKLLHKHLGFITDEHLAIGEQIFGTDVRLFSNETEHYIKSGEKYFSKDDPQNAIVEINGKQPEKYLKRAIDENGRLTYYPYARLKQKEDICSYILKYENGDTKSVSLKPAKYSYKKDLDRMYGYDKYDNAGTLVDEWFYRYTGKQLLPNYSTLRIRPVWISDAKELREMDAFADETGLEKSGKYYYRQYPGHQYLENGDRQIFVLTSAHTCSAAEAMTDALKNIENTVVIGTNTGGVLLNMANYSLAMPYSGLLLQFGEAMQYFDPSYFQESYGLEPDIYLTGKNLNKRLETFFELYVDGLN